MIHRGRPALIPGAGVSVRKLPLPPIDTAMRLDTELATFARYREQLQRDHLGRFALVIGSELVGVFPTENDAYAAGT